MVAVSGFRARMRAMITGEAELHREGPLMNSVSRRKLLYTGTAAVAGAAGLATAARIAETLRPHPARSSAASTARAKPSPMPASASSPRVVPVHEFPRSMISKQPFMNEIGKLPDAFKASQAANFSDWRLTVDGLVEHPLSLSVSDLRTLATRSQITEVACEEGWSYIAEWIGTPLSAVLSEAGLKPEARFLAYFSIQPDWWDSVDLADALHPGTLVTWGMNDGDLPVGFGGPLAPARPAPARLQERQVPHAHHRHRLDEALRQRPRLRLSRRRLRLVRRDIAKRSATAAQKVSGEPKLP